MNLERVIAVRTNETVYRGGDQCVKVFGDGFTKADALGEALNQARVEECGLHVPKVLEVSQVDGKWALVTEYVEGKTLERLIEEEPGRKEELLERMAELQVEMISKSCPLLSRLKDKMNRKISQADLDAKTIVSESETLQRARMKSAEIIHRAEERTNELYRVANSYTEDALRRTEEAIQMALDEVRQSRTRFRAASNEQMQQIRSGNASSSEEKPEENEEN